MTGFGLDSLGQLLLNSRRRTWQLRATGRVETVTGYRPGHQFTRAGKGPLLLPARVDMPLPYSYLALSDSTLVENLPGWPPRVVGRWRFPRRRTGYVPRTDVLEPDSTWYWPGDGEVLGLSIRRQAGRPTVQHYPLPVAREWDLELRFNYERTGLWAFATGVAGMWQITPRNLPATALPVAGATTLSTRTINRLADGRLVVGSYAGTFTQAADSPDAPLRRWLGQPFAYTWFASLRLPDGRLLIANEDGRIELLSGSRLTELAWREPHSVPTGRSNFCLLRDHAGRLWAGGQAGLFQIDLAHGTRARYREADPNWPLHHCGDVEALAEGTAGELWLATSHGPYCLQPATGALRHYGPDEPSPRRLPTAAVRCVLVTHPDSVWVGTADAGLLLLHPRRGLQRQLTVHHGLPSAAVAFVAAPDRGPTLWVGTYKGLVRYNTQTGHRSDLATLNGMATNEMNRQSVWYDAARGQLCAGGVGGVSRLVARAPIRPEPRPRLLLTALTQHHAEGDTIRTEYLNGSLPAGVHLAPAMPSQTCC